MKEVFITLVEKQTVMCLCGVIGRSDHVDRMLRSVHPNSSVYSVIGRCQRPVSTDRTRPVTIFPLWNLTGVNRTLALGVQYHDLAASGHFQTLSP